MEQVKVRKGQIQLWGEPVASRSQHEPCTCPESSPGAGGRLLPPREGQAPEIHLKPGRVTLWGIRPQHLGEVFIETASEYVLWQDGVFA